MFIRAAYLLSQSKNAIAALALRRYLGLRYRSAWPIKHKLMSDGLGAFRAVADLNHAHTVIQAPSGKAGTEVDGARWVNVVLGNLKRSLDGTCHAFGFFKYAERCLAEAAWRFNRRFDLKALVRRLLVTAAACPP